MYISFFLSGKKCLYSEISYFYSLLFPSPLSPLLLFLPHSAPLPRFKKEQLCILTRKLNIHTAIFLWTDILKVAIHIFFLAYPTYKVRTPGLSVCLACM